MKGKLTMNNNDPKMIHALAQFPGEFALVGFPGDVFRVCPGASFMRGNIPILYTQRLGASGEWIDFAKGTVDELRDQVRLLPEPRRRYTAEEVEDMRNAYGSGSRDLPW